MADYNRAMPFRANIAAVVVASASALLIGCGPSRERQIEQHAATIERYCVSRQVPYFAADVDMPFDELVLKVFRSGGFLR